MDQKFEIVVVKVTTTGSAGSATGSTDTEYTVNGKLYAVYLDYHASAPATSDVTVAQADGPSATLLTVSDNATDGWYFPRQQVHSTAGAGLTYDGTRVVAEAFPVVGNVTVSVAQADALTDCVTAYLYVMQ